jgi:hypothetical protein
MSLLHAAEYYRLMDTHSVQFISITPFEVPAHHQRHIIPLFLITLLLLLLLLLLLTMLNRCAREVWQKITKCTLLLLLLLLLFDASAFLTQLQVSCCNGTALYCCCCCCCLCAMRRKQCW